MEARRTATLASPAIVAFTLWAARATSARYTLARAFSGLRRPLAPFKLQLGMFPGPLISEPGWVCASPYNEQVSFRIGEHEAKVKWNRSTDRPMLWTRWVFAPIFYVEPCYV
jgi:hypothetical protein